MSHCALCPDGRQDEFSRRVPAARLPVLARIFDKGYRGENAGGVAGSGLGLYMARSVVEVHGGSLTYACPPEGGAEFRL